MNKMHSLDLAPQRPLEVHLNLQMHSFLYSCIFYDDFVVFYCMKSFRFSIIFLYDKVTDAQIIVVGEEIKLYVFIMMSSAVFRISSSLWSSVIFPTMFSICFISVYARLAKLFYKIALSCNPGKRNSLIRSSDAGSG